MFLIIKITILIKIINKIKNIKGVNKNKNISLKQILNNHKLNNYNIILKLNK